MSKSQLLLTMLGLLTAFVSSAALAQTSAPRTTDRGFVFIDGEYLERPYVVANEGESVTINNRSVSVTIPGGPAPSFPPPQRNDSRNERGRGWERESNRERFGRGPGGGPPRPDAALAIFDQLNGDAVVVAFGRERAMVFTSSNAVTFLKLIVRKDGGAAAREALLYNVPIVQHEQWTSWLDQYKAPASFLAVAESHLAGIQEVTISNEASMSANQRLQAWAYPLTVLGMILGVMALGHLLQTPPQRAFEASRVRRQRELCRATVISLVLVVLLSALDLGWTVLASQAGQMAGVESDRESIDREPADADGLQGDSDTHQLRAIAPPAPASEGATGHLVGLPRLHAADLPLARAELDVCDVRRALAARGGAWRSSLSRKNNRELAEIPGRLGGW